MTPETLARLTAQAPSLIASGGGKAALTQAEVAGVLCKISEIAEAYARLVYMLDPAGMDQLERQAQRETESVFRRHDWHQGRHGDMIGKLARIALDEVLIRPVCVACNGTRHEPAGGWCTTCHGSGHTRERYNDRQRAEFAGMVYTTWISTWRGRYIQVRQRIAYWVANLDGQVWEGLRGQ